MFGTLDGLLRLFPGLQAAASLRAWFEAASVPGWLRISGHILAFQDVQQLNAAVPALAAGDSPSLARSIFLLFGVPGPDR